MADVSQVETSFSFEPRSAPVNTKESSRPQDTDASDPPRAFEPSQSSRSDTVALSREARQPSPKPDNAAEPTAGDAEQSEGFDTTFETSATGGLDGADDGARTNQVTSFQAERTGNDTRSTTEARRTLGQVVDTFA